MSFKVIETSEIIKLVVITKGKGRNVSYVTPKTSVQQKIL